MPVNPAHLTVEHVEHYLDVILKNHTARTANAHLTAIKSFCRWSAEHYDIPNAAAKIRMLTENPPRQRVITEEEYQAVLDVCEDGEADIIKLLANTGLRSSELLSLELSNISPDLKFLRIVGKGRKARTIPLNKTCRKILSNPINFSKNRNSLYALCKKLSLLAKIPVAGPHSYRHFFATRLIQQGVSLTKVSKILGHADTRTTERIYCHLVAEIDLAGITEVLD